MMNDQNQGTYKRLKDFHMLAEIVAENLAGKDIPVTIRFRAPAIDQFNGSASKTQIGAVIDIDPDRETDIDQLFTLLHECAHLRIGWNEMKLIENPVDLEPRSIKLSQKRIKELGLSDEAKERQCDEMARDWMKYADDHCHEFGDHPIESRLIALNDWCATEFDKQVKEIYWDVLARMANAKIIKSFQRARVTHSRQISDITEKVKREGIK